MKPELEALLDHIVHLVHEFSPSTIAALTSRIGALPENEHRSVLIGIVTTAESQKQIADLVRLWSAVPSLDAKALAHAILGAQRASDRAIQSLTANLVWTGPQTELIPFRRTDQVLLELINEAREQLLIVSFVAYKVPRVAMAIQQATDRGVGVKIVLEIAEESGGKVTFDGIYAMHKAIPHAQIFYWPSERRGKDDQGRYGALHAKCAVADGVVGFISSANLTEFAMELNMELGILIRGGRCPLQIVEHFEELIRRQILLPAH